MTGPAVFKIHLFLCNAVDSLCQAGYFSGCVVLVIHTLGSSLVNGRSSSQQSSGSSLFILGSYSSVHFLHGSLHSRLDCLIALIPGLGHQNSLLRRLNISQTVHLQTFLILNFVVPIKIGHGRLM